MVQEVGSFSPAAGRPLRILLAEDNVYNQKVAIGMLEMDKHTVTVANNGREAVEAFARQAFDLVLMDMQMPEMDGAQATQLIRQYQQSNGLRIPIVAMTAHAMAGDREKCLAAGMDDYVSKPISRDELVTVILRNSGSPVAQEEAGTKAPVGPNPPETSVPKNGSASASSANQLISQEEMLNRVGGNRKLLRDLAEMFPDESRKLLAAMKEARSAKNAPEVQLNAHTLKGICKMFGASAAAAAALDLETAGSTGGLGTDEQVNVLTDELDQVVQAVNTFHSVLGD